MIDASLVDAMAQVLDAAPGLFDRLATRITLDRAHRYLDSLESVAAPSQTARWTRAPIVESLLREDELLGSPRVTWSRDFAGTGNAALLLGRQPRRKRVWLLAHLDQISYLVDPGDGERYPLVPNCYHMQQDGQRPALALGFDLERGGLAVRARGMIEVAGSEVTFVVQEGGPLGPGARVVYDSRLQWDAETHCLIGTLDDTLGCTAALLAADVLRHYPVEVFVGLTDEEEGPQGNANQSFCRGGRRLLGLLERPELVIVSDVHEAEPVPRHVYPGDGAVFAERSSDGRGSVTPPHLYALQQHLAAALRQRGIALQENWGGYVSRSEDINAVATTPNVALIGVLCSNRHYEKDQPAANLTDVVDLAKTLAAYVILVHSDLWPELTAAGDRSPHPQEALTP